MAAESLFTNELLCYLLNKYGNSPSDSVKAVILSFYTPTEISIAKDAMFKAAALINEDGLPRLIQRRKFDDKVRLDVDDVFMMLEALDERALLARLPKYVAADLSRLPPFNSGDLDMTLLMLRVATLETKMSQMVGECVEAARATMHDGAATTSQPCQINAATAAMTSSSAPEVPVVSWNQASADVTDHTPQQSSSGAEWTVVVNNKSNVKTLSNVKTSASPPQERRFSGKHATSPSSQVKAIPRKLHVFASRLDNDTTEDDLSSWFECVGIPGVKCVKIKPPEGRTFRTSAFKVTCDVKFADMFYDENNWPEGCDVRDWYVRRSTAVSS